MLIGRIKTTTNSKLKINVNADGKRKENVVCEVTNADLFLTFKVVSLRVFVLIYCFSGNVFMVTVALGPSPCPVTPARVMLYLAAGVKFSSR